MSGSSEALEEQTRPVPPARPRRPLRHRLVAGTIFSLLSIVIGQVFALVTSVMYARILGPTNLGILAIYTQLTALTASVAGLGLATPVARFVSRLRSQSPHELSNFVATVLVITLGSGVITSASFFALSNTIARDVYATPGLAAMFQIAAIFLAFDSLAALAMPVLQGLQKIRVLSILGILIEAATIPVMFASLTAFGLLGAAVGGAGLTLFGAALLFGSARRHLRDVGVRIRLSFDRRWARDLFHYATPLLGSIVIVKLAFLSQSSLLALSLGYSEMGLFRVATSLSRILAFVPAALSIPLLPALAELYAVSPEERTRTNLTILVRMTSYLACPIALALAAGASTIIVTLYGPSYSAATTVAFVLILTGFVDILGAIAAYSLLGEGRTGSLLLIDLLQCGLLVAGTFALVRWLGLVGAGFANLLASLAYGTVVFAVLGRRGRIDLAKAAGALPPALGWFAVATMVVLWGPNGSTPSFLALILVASIGSAWTLMSSGERSLLVGATRGFLRRGKV